MPKTPDVDHLFQLPLAEFTRARNALVAELAKEGRRDESARVRGLAKPSLSAWAVNQLHWRHRKDLEALLDAGDRVRAGQSAQVAGKDVDLRPLLEARRDATARLARHAAMILREAKHSPTPETLRRVTTTLDALAAYGTSHAAPDAGHLTADVDPPGFEALAGLVSGRSVRQAARVLPLRRHPPDREPARESARSAAEARRVAEARDAVRRAEAALHAARRAEAQAKASFEKAADRARAAAREKDAMAAAYERAAKAVTGAERELARARAGEARTRAD